MLKLEPSSPVTVRVSPTLISSLALPLVNLAPEESETRTEFAVTDTSLKTGSSFGKVPATATSSVAPLICSWAVVSVRPVVVPDPLVDAPDAVEPPENGSLPGKTPKFVS